jgi:hypothetical protein
VRPSRWSLCRCETASPWRSAVHAWSVCGPRCGRGRLLGCGLPDAGAARSRCAAVGGGRGSRRPVLRRRCQLVVARVDEGGCEFFQPFFDSLQFRKGCSHGGYRDAVELGMHLPELLLNDHDGERWIRCVTSTMRKSLGPVGVEISTHAMG